MRYKARAEIHLKTLGVTINLRTGPHKNANLFGKSLKRSLTLKKILLSDLIIVYNSYDKF